MDFLAVNRLPLANEATLWAVTCCDVGTPSPLPAIAAAAGGGHFTRHHPMKYRQFRTCQKRTYDVFIPLRRVSATFLGLTCTELNALHIYSISFHRGIPSFSRGPPFCTTLPTVVFLRRKRLQNVSSGRYAGMRRSTVKPPYCGHRCQFWTPTLITQNYKKRSLGDCLAAWGRFA